MQFEYVVTYCSKINNKMKKMIIEAFGKLFYGLDMFGFMMEPEEFAVIAGTYFTVINQALETNIFHYAKGS